MKHKYNKELIYHFNCGKCNKWWSIADFLLIHVGERKEELRCPHCGHKETIEEGKYEKTR